jgi:ATP-dependent exoDNAse (exonuclease V) beta subunit
MKEDTNKTDHTIIFNEEEHTYTVKETGQTLTSCTRFISNFFPKFDTEYWLEECSKRENISKEQLAQRWEHQKNVACDTGSNIHKFAEQLINDEKTILPKNDYESVLFFVTKNQVKKLKRDYELVATEKILFSEKLGLAGTTDIIMKKDDTLYIFDWKTNNEMVLENPQEKCLKPLSHLDSCDITKYSLQLNIYKKLILQEKYYEFDKIKMAIFHIQSSKVTTYIIEDYLEEVMLILEAKDGSSKIRS